MTRIFNAVITAAHYTYHDVIRYIIQYLPTAVILGVVFCVAYAIIKKITWQEGDLRGSELFRVFILAVYGVAVAFITVLNRAPGSEDAVDLQFLVGIGLTTSYLAELIENVLLFVPLGVMLPTVLPRRGGQGIFRFICVGGLGFIGSLAIEVTQLITSRGMFQIDDLVMNTLGALAGCMLYTLVAGE